MSSIKDLIEKNITDPFPVEVAKGGTEYVLRPPFFHEFSLNFSVVEDRKIFPYFFVKTSSFAYEGERTDLNDTLSILLAFFLRSSRKEYSTLVWDMEHPVRVPEVEVYARYITVEQPLPRLFDFNHPVDIALLKDLVEDFMFSVQMFSIFSVDEHQHSKNLFSWNTPEIQKWGHEISKALGIDPSHAGITFNQRCSPTWKFFRSIKKHVSLLESVEAAGLIEKLFSSTKTIQNPETKSLLIQGSESQNVVPGKVVRVANRICKTLKISPRTIQYAAIENFVAASFGPYLAWFNVESGREKFKFERSSIQRRHQKEFDALFKGQMLSWLPSATPEQFELLILDLLKLQNGVERARKCGHANDADHGRDIMLDWLMPTYDTELVEGGLKLNSRKILVQCKLSKGSVGKSQVADIRDTMDYHAADGYFLVVSSFLTEDLINYLEKLSSKGMFCDWWGKSEIEAQLSNSPEIVSKYREKLFLWGFPEECV